MRHIMLGNLTDMVEAKAALTTAILIKPDYLKKEELHTYYVNYLSSKGIDANTLVAFDLHYPSNQKNVKVADANDYLATLLKGLSSLGITTIYCADSTYLKVLIGEAKVTNTYGYVYPCAIKGYEHIDVVPGINYQTLVYNPNKRPELITTLDALHTHLTGGVIEDEEVIHEAQYPDTIQGVYALLHSLHNKPMLACDIEGYGLALETAGVATIGFAYSEHAGTAFCVDFRQTDSYTVAVKRMLRMFFERYQGTLVFHFMNYDMRNIIYNLFMDHPLDYRGMLHGLHTMCRDFHDTKIIAYLATNNAVENELGLKALSAPFMGRNYAIDVKDITKHETDVVLKYNLADCCATYWVFKKYYPIMIAEEQEQIYNEIMKPSIKSIGQAELCGMPLDMVQVVQVCNDLTDIANTQLDIIRSNRHVVAVCDILKRQAHKEAHEKWKQKTVAYEDFPDHEFNPNSPNQVTTLLYDYLGLPVLNKTKTGNPSADKDTLELLPNHTTDADTLALLKALLAYAEVFKVISSFLPAFKKATPKDGWHYLHGSFNIGGTLSGRLSSSDPNLQNIPSSGKLGKLIKSCFVAPAGWLFGGADFNALIARAAA